MCSRGWEINFMKINHYAGEIFTGHAKTLPSKKRTNYFVSPPPQLRKKNRVWQAFLGSGTTSPTLGNTTSVCSTM